MRVQKILQEYITTWTYPNLYVVMHQNGRFVIPHPVSSAEYKFSWWPKKEHFVCFTLKWGLLHLECRIITYRDPDRAKNHFNGIHNQSNDDVNMYIWIQGNYDHCYHTPGTGRKLLDVLMTEQEGFKSEQVDMEEVETSFGFWYQRRVLGCKGILWCWRVLGCLTILGCWGILGCFLMLWFCRILQHWSRGMIWSWRRTFFDL